MCEMAKTWTILHRERISTRLIANRPNRTLNSSRSSKRLRLDGSPCLGTVNLTNYIKTCLVTDPSGFIAKGNSLFSTLRCSCNARNQPSKH